MKIAPSLVLPLPRFPPIFSASRGVGGRSIFCEELQRAGTLRSDAGWRRRCMATKSPRPTSDASFLACRATLALSQPGSAHCDSIQDLGRSIRGGGGSFLASARACEPQALAGHAVQRCDIVSAWACVLAHGFDDTSWLALAPPAAAASSPLPSCLNHSVSVRGRRRGVALRSWVRKHEPRAAARANAVLFPCGLVVVGCHHTSAVLACMVCNRVRVCVGGGGSNR